MSVRRMTNATNGKRNALSEGDKKAARRSLPLTFDVYGDDTVATYIECRGERA